MKGGRDKEKRPGGESQVGGRKIYLCFQNTNIKFLTEIMKTTKLHLSLGWISFSFVLFYVFFPAIQEKGGIGLTKYMLAGR